MTASPGHRQDRWTKHYSFTSMCRLGAPCSAVHLRSLLKGTEHWQGRTSKTLLAAVRHPPVLPHLWSLPVLRAVSLSQLRFAIPTPLSSDPLGRGTSKDYPGGKRVTTNSHDAVRKLENSHLFQISFPIRYNGVVWNFDIYCLLLQCRDSFQPWQATLSRMLADGESSCSKVSEQCFASWPLRKQESIWPIQLSAQ